MSFTSGSVLQEGQSRQPQRHQSQCSVCSHPQSQELEEAWLDWGSTTLLAEKYGLSRDCIYRHAHRLGLYRERQNRIKRLYEKVLERLDTVKFSVSDLAKVLKEYTALCEREEAKQETESAGSGSARPGVRAGNRSACRGWGSAGGASTSARSQG